MRLPFPSSTFEYFTQLAALEMQQPQLFGQQDLIGQSSCMPGAPFGSLFDQYEGALAQQQSPFCQIPQTPQSVDWTQALTSPGCGYPYNALNGVQSSICPCPMPPPSDNPSFSQSRVFVIGDLKHFGGTTVRAGFKEMLRPTEGLKDRAGERTHSVLSAEDAQTVRTLLASKDPTVMKSLATKVPDGQSIVVGADGQILNTVSTKDSIIPDASLDVAAHAQHINDKNVPRIFDRSAGGQLSLGNTNYSVAGTELHSPIKIALDGKSAQLNSTNGFNIALNGFGGPVTHTSGGLNANEAWLVRDRDGQGIMRNGVVNGNDVYGDHNGKVGDGYQDLAKDFADEVKVDPRTGGRYIDLTDPRSRAAQELKLLDGSGKLVPAASVLNRIDVGEKLVNEADQTGQNVIKERAQVTYKDGHSAASADQWFKAAPTKQVR